MKIDRRKFLKNTAAASAALTILPRRVLGGTGYIAPSDQLTKAVIGVGGMGTWHVRQPGTVLLAVCDVDEDHLRTAMEIGGPEVKGYKDFREVLARPDIDIVSIATPPHWHALMSIEAAKAGKDIWCEKPMTRTIWEGQKVADTVRKAGRIFRINTWFRFRSQFYGFGTEVRPIKKLVESGMLGWPLSVTISQNTGFSWKFYWRGRTNLKPEWIPKVLDYEMWLGPAPYRPYNSHRVHASFRGYWDYDGGGLGDMGQHYLDPIQYILGKDKTSPVEVEADAPQQHPDAVGTWRRIEMKYEDGCKIILDGEEKLKKTPFIKGPDGELYKGFESNIPNLKEKVDTLPQPEAQEVDFFDAVRNRRKFALNEQNGHRSATLVNLGKIAVQLGRKLHFDPDKQRFVGDEEANRLVKQHMRSPWHL